MRAAAWRDRAWCIGWEIAVALIRWSGLPWLVRNTWARRRVAIFRYHNPDPDCLRRQLRYLARAYTFITLEDLVAAIESRDWSSIPPKSLVITFDDGWSENLELLELCREVGVRPTVYLCSAVAGTTRHFWWTECGDRHRLLTECASATMEKLLREATGFHFERKYAVRQAMSRSEIARMSKVASFQSHSRFHRILPRATAAQLDDEIVRSKRELERLTRSRCDHFAYPNGAYDECVVQQVRQAGYRSARTTDVGWNSVRSDPFRLKIAGGPDRGGANAAAASLFGMYARLVWRGSFAGKFRDERLPIRHRVPKPVRPRHRRPSVVVTDVDKRSGLAGSRAFAAAGYAVTGAASEWPAPGHWSRSCGDAQRITDPHLSRRAFARELESVLAAGVYDAVVPGSDAALLAVSEERKRLERHVALGLPPHEVVERVTDKLAVVEAARAVGIPTPETIVCSMPGEALEAAASLGRRLVVKPQRSVTATVEGGFRAGGARFAWDKRQLRRIVSEHRGPLLLQQAVAGHVWSVAGAIADGRLLATAVSRYVRTWPPEGGCACFSQTVAPPDGLVESVRALLRELGWQGIFEVELIQRPQGSFAVIDVNPRLYGSLALAVGAGAPIPVVWARWLRGENPAPVVARPAVRYRFEDADLRYGLVALRRGDFRTAIAAVRPHRHVLHAYARLSDPGPLAGRLVQIGVHRLRSLRLPARTRALRPLDLSTVAADSAAEPAAAGAGFSDLAKHA